MRYLILVGVLAFCCYSQYYWPVTDVSTRQCRGTFGEYRYNSDPIYCHFHEGIDIYPVYNDNEVISTWWGGYEVEEITFLGENLGYAVTIQHYNFTVTGSETTWVEQNHGSRYLHMHTDPHLHLSENHRYPDDVYIIENSTFYNNHLHFEIRNPAPIGSDYRDAYNPMYVDANLCPDDNSSPILDSLYADGSISHQGDATIECWNFLGYNFDGYYNATAAAPFVTLTLPGESRDNDLDDPHILVSGNRKARFVLEGYDNINTDNDIAAPYELSLFLFDADSLGVSQKSYYTLRFDSLLDSTDEVHQEEDVYHVSAPLISGINAPQYYRLSPEPTLGY